MHAVVVYDSKFGNTEKVANAIAQGVRTVGTVKVMAVADATAALTDHPDLFLVGGPTQRRSMSPGLQAFVDGLAPGSVRGVPTAAFDTRYRGATWIMGSAAAQASDRLRKAGGQLLAPPTSFFISRAERQLEHQGLEDGELARAEQWGRAVGAQAINETAPR